VEEIRKWRAVEALWEWLMVLRATSDSGNQLSTQEREREIQIEFWCSRDLAWVLFGVIKSLVSRAQKPNYLLTTEPNLHASFLIYPCSFSHAVAKLSLNQSHQYFRLKSLKLLIHPFDRVNCRKNAQISVVNFLVSDM